MDRKTDQMNSKDRMAMICGAALLVVAMVCLYLVLNNGNPSKEVQTETDPDSGLPRVGFGETIERTFVLKNDTDDPLFIDEISPSCTCVSIKDKGLGAQPGESVQFTAVFRGETLGKNEIQIVMQLAGIEKSVNEVFHLDAIVTPPASFAKFAENEAQRAREADYVVSAPEALAKVSGSKASKLFDFRPAALALRGTIPNAIALSLGEIEAFPGKDQDAIFLGGAVLRNDLRDKIDKLASRNDSFKSMRVLDGGLRGWRLAGGSLVGSDQEGVDLYSLNVADTKKIVGRNDWKIVSLGKAREKTGIDLVFPGSSQTVADFSQLDALRTELLALFDLAYKEDKKLLLISERGEGYQWIEGLTKEASPAAVHYLRGGIASYFAAMSAVEYKPRTERKLITLVEYNGQQVTGGRRPRARGCPSCPK